MAAGATWVLRGHRALRLKRQLAEGRIKQVDLAAEYDVAESTIASFKATHKVEIAEIAADLDNEFAGLWAAQKAARIAEYMDTIKVVDTALELQPLAQDRSGLLLRKQGALKAIAEELGQLQQRIEIDGKLNYQVNGVTPEDVT